MAFSIFVNSTTADSADMNDNFYHIGQGSVLPRGGNNLEATTGVFDLGSSSFKWKNVVAAIVDANNITADNLWAIKAESLITSTVSRIEFTGLNGDSQIEYQLYIYGRSTATTAITLYFNGDSSTVNYNWMESFSNSSTVSQTGHTQTALQLADMGNTGEACLVRCYINAATGFSRTIMVNSLNNASGTTIDELSFRGGYWSNNISTITSIQLKAVNFGIDSHIFLMGRG